jgi:hypothetical protein
VCGPCPPQAGNLSSELSMFDIAPLHQDADGSDNSDAPAAFQDDQEE